MHSANHYFHLSKLFFIGTNTGDDLTKKIIVAPFPFTIHKEYGYTNFTQTIISLRILIILIILCSTEMEMFRL